MQKNVYEGTIIYAGFARGPVFKMTGSSPDVNKYLALNPEREEEIVRDAIEKTNEQLTHSYEEALREVGEQGAQIFLVYQLILYDENFCNRIYERIREERCNAVYAVYATAEYICKVYKKQKDADLNARNVDIRAIAMKVIRNICNYGEDDFSEMEPSIIVAEDLSVEELLKIDREKILGIVTTGGFVNSHAAILARMRRIPSIIRTNLDYAVISNGQECIVNALAGEVIVNPSIDQSAEAESWNKLHSKVNGKRVIEKGLPAQTKGGRSIHLYANISDVSECELALENDAEGIGLLRSEFMFLGRNSMPTEEMQFQMYKSVLEKMGNREVVIRTLDLGADKQLGFVPMERETNPAIGYRGIRVSVCEKEMFKEQFRALLRASVYGNLSVMYPMVTSVEEVLYTRSLVEEAKSELAASGIPYKPYKQGIMVETPAAVMISDELAKVSDFFSIGTNDLTQYTLAMDPKNEKLREMYDCYHPAIMRMIQKVCESAAAADIEVSICGELASDETMMQEFLDAGVDILSVSSEKIADLRDYVRGMK